MTVKLCDVDVPLAGNGPGVHPAIRAEIGRRRPSSGLGEASGHRGAGQLAVRDDNRLGLRLLGGLVVQVPGEAPPSLGGGSRRLLAFLALHDHALSRIAVAGTLWPDASEEHAYASLRSAISRLNGSAPRAIRVSLHALGLAQEVDVDLRSAQALAHRLLASGSTASEADDLTAAAVAALSADLLPGWYDDWAVLEAEDWRQLRVHALEALADRLIANHRYGIAASAALAAVRAEPLRESARAALVRVHLAEGNQSEALREFGRYRSLLRRELGLEPTSRLRGLLEKLRRP